MMAGTTMERTVKGQCGDPVYLQVAQPTLVDKWRIWGSDSPKRIDSNSNEWIRNSAVYDERVPIDATAHASRSPSLVTRP